MKALTNVDLALIPMNLPYTMTPEEAAVCVSAFKPKQVTPIHYAGSDLAKFAPTGTEVVLRDAYPGGLPW
jgi:L-ascorbate metabolism protein UlaG (beta-lactamase superfamily)